MFAREFPGQEKEILDRAKQLCMVFEDEEGWDEMNLDERQQWWRAGKVSLEIEARAREETRREMLAKVGNDELSIRLDLARIERMSGEHPAITLAKMLREHRDSLERAVEEVRRVVSADLHQPVVEGLRAKINLVDEYLQ